MGCCDACAHREMMATACGAIGIQRLSSADEWTAYQPIEEGETRFVGAPIVLGPHAFLRQRYTLGGYVLPEIRTPLPFGRAILLSGPCAGGSDWHLAGNGNGNGAEREPWVWTPRNVRPYMARVDEGWQALNRDVQARTRAGVEGEQDPLDSAWKQRFSAQFAQWQRFRNESSARLDRFEGVLPEYGVWSDVGNETRNWQLRLIEWREEFREQGGTPTGPEPEVPRTPELPTGTVEGWTNLLWPVALILGLALVAAVVVR